MQSTALHSSSRLCLRQASSRAQILPITRPRLSPSLLRAADASASISPTQDATESPVPSSLMELTKDNYWSFMDSAENKDVLIVVDCYTDWCGPCKMIYPDLVKLSAELEPRARVVKFNCNKYNKELGVELKIKVAPTFLFYKNNQKVAEMTGAKLEKLKSIISENLDPAMAVGSVDL